MSELPRKLSRRERELLSVIQECNGTEVHRSDWAVADRLVKAGLVTLGGARGPNKSFRRATLTEKARAT